MFKKYEHMKEVIKDPNTFDSDNKYSWYIKTYWWDKIKNLITQNESLLYWMLKNYNKNSVKIKREKKGKNVKNLYFYCYDCGL